MINVKHSIASFALALVLAVSQACAIRENVVESQDTKDNMAALAEPSDLRGQAGLGLAYLEGVGVKKDIAKGLALLEKSASGGDVYAQFILGRYLVLHGNTDASYHAAMIWLTKAVEQGCRESLVYIGVLYVSGKGVKKDIDHGFKLLRDAATSGDVAAQLLVGVMLVTGDGVEKDEYAGFKWIEKAARQGDSGAAIVLASLYLDGVGVDKQPVIARSILEEVFKRGDKYDAVAAYHLGWMYMGNAGISIDRVRAVRWMAIAARGGIEDSTERIMELVNGMKKTKTSTDCPIHVGAYYGGGKDKKLDAGVEIVVVSEYEELLEVYVPGVMELGYVSADCVYNDQERGATGYDVR